LGGSGKRKGNDGSGNQEPELHTAPQSFRGTTINRFGARCKPGVADEFEARIPSGAKARSFLGLMMYGLKPVPFN